MTFAPKSGDHAIVECVLGLQFLRPFTPGDIDKVNGSHDSWREAFPRRAVSGGFQIQLGGAPGAIRPEQMPAGVLFDRVRPDGTLEQRLRVGGSAIFFNSLNYTRWSEIWSKGRKWFELVCGLLELDANPIASAVLQYIDVFEWQGKEEDYNPSELLRLGGFVPQSVLEKGPLWHLHQGWYRREPKLGEGRLLERLHIDAVTNENKRPTVRVDTYLNFEPKNQPQFVPDLFLGQHGEGKAWFDQLHFLDKELLQSALTDDICKMIGLDDV